MKSMFTTLAVVALAVSANAQGILNPASGTYYPDDAMNQGCITAVFDETVATPTATITVNSTAYTAEVEDISFDSTIWRVNVADVMNGQAAGTEFDLSIGGLTGSYTWQPVFPLTDVTPTAGTELTSKTQNVVFTFSPAISYTGVRLTSGTEIHEIVQSGNGVNTVTVAISESDWGTPVAGVNSMTVALLGVTANGVSISNASGSEGTILAQYTIADEGSDLAFLNVDPTSEEATYQEVYDGYWYVSFNFNNELEVPMDETTVLATVTFYDSLGWELDEVELTSLDVFGDWNYRAGYYTVQVAVPEVTEDAEDYATATVALHNLSYNGKVVADLPSVTYYETLPSKSVKKAIGTAGIANIGEDSNLTNDIYSISGALVKSDATKNDLQSLEKGFYVVNGNKIVVR